MLQQVSFNQLLSSAGAVGAGWGLCSALSGLYGCRGRGRVGPGTAVTSRPPFQDSEQLHGAAKDQPGAGGQAVPHGEGTPHPPSPQHSQPWAPSSGTMVRTSGLAVMPLPVRSWAKGLVSTPPAPCSPGLGRSHLSLPRLGALQHSPVTVPTVQSRD